jgi:hypothetical protein
MTPIFPVRRLALAVVAVLLVACQNPRVQANMAEAINEFGTQVSGINQDLAAIQFQVDSLKQVAARQDTIIARLAQIAGVQIPR